MSEKCKGKIDLLINEIINVIDSSIFLKLCEICFLDSSESACEVHGTIVDKCHINGDGYPDLKVKVKPKYMTKNKKLSKCLIIESKVGMSSSKTTQIKKVLMHTCTRFDVLPTLENCSKRVMIIAFPKEFKPYKRHIDKTVKKMKYCRKNIIFYYLSQKEELSRIMGGEE